MKKVFALGLCLALAIGMVACGGPGEEEFTPEEKIAQNATTGKISVEIVSAATAKDTKDGDAVVVNYTFKNDTNKNRDFKSSTDCKVFQGEEKLKGTAVSIGEVYKESVATKMVEPGQSIEVQMCYALVDTTTPLKITCNIISGEDKATIEKEIPIG